MTSGSSTEEEIDFHITVSIPVTQNHIVKSKQWTEYKIVLEAKSCKTTKVWQWTKGHRYNEFYGLYHQLKKDFPTGVKEIKFPPKRVFGRFNAQFVKERRIQLEEFIGSVVENPAVINSSVHLRSFLEIDKNLSCILMHEKKRSYEILGSENAENEKHQFAKALFTFEARNEEELSVVAGEYLIIINTEDNNGWWEGKLRGSCGFVPKDYVQLTDDIPEDYDDANFLSDLPPPTVPEPALPNRMNEETRERRRTVLLAKLEAPKLPDNAPEKKSKQETIPHVIGTALYRFKGQSAFELVFEKGDTIIVYTIDQNTGWWQGKANGAVGYFPGSYVLLPAGAEDQLLGLCEDPIDDHSKSKPESAEASKDPTADPVASLDPPSEHHPVPEPEPLPSSSNSEVSPALIDSPTLLDTSEPSENHSNHVAEPIQTPESESEETNTPVAQPEGAKRETRIRSVHPATWNTPNTLTMQIPLTSQTEANKVSDVLLVEHIKDPQISPRSATQPIRISVKVEDKRGSIMAKSPPKPEVNVKRKPNMLRKLPLIPTSKDKKKESKEPKSILETNPEEKLAPGGIRAQSTPESQPPIVIPKPVNQPKTRSIRLSGGLSKIPQKPVEPIQNVPPSLLDAFERKCIICTCEHWTPSEFEATICKHCRHLSRMHRTMSKLIRNPIYS